MPKSTKQHMSPHTRLSENFLLMMAMNNLDLCWKKTLFLSYKGEGDSPEKDWKLLRRTWVFLQCALNVKQKNMQSQDQ